MAETEQTGNSDYSSGKFYCKFCKRTFVKQRKKKVKKPVDNYLTFIDHLYARHFNQYCAVTDWLEKEEGI